MQSNLNYESSITGFWGLILLCFPRTRLFFRLSVAMLRWDGFREKRRLQERPRSPCPESRAPRTAGSEEGGSTASATEKGCSCIQFNSHRAQRGRGIAEGSDLTRRCGQGAPSLPERLCGRSSPRRLPGPAESRGRLGISWGSQRPRTGPVSPRRVGTRGCAAALGRLEGGDERTEKG